jgi:DNA-binding CsgD family transcriptional regulator
MMRHPDTVPRANSKLEILEAAYGHGSDQSDWLPEIGETLRRSVPDAVSCYCFEVYRADNRVQISRPWTEDPQVAAQLQETFALAPAPLLDLFFARPLQACTSRDVLQAAGVAFESTPFGDVYRGLGFADVFAVTAVGPAGRGVVLGIGLSRPGGPEPHERVEWVHVAAHVAAARRLQVLLAGDSAIERASAVLSPEGRVEHLATADADADGIAAILREAVKQVEHARKHARSDAEALSLWKGLVDGRWSLVEQFESDGRRFYAAIRNPVDAVKLRALTRREAEVTAYVATGTTTKSTAYALGLDEVTVRGYLRAAMMKLGMRSRTELIALRAALEPGADGLAQS